VPAYEYICDKCHQSFSLSIPYELYGKAEAACPHCGSTAVTRCIGKVRIGRSEGARLRQIEEKADTLGLQGGDENPAEMGRMLHRLSRESGAQMGDQFNEVVDRLEHGQTSAQIDKDLPDPDGTKT
jgi:putative FmdB family regulatory protein